ncbi:O-antigen ligase family protein [Streptococcus suis]|uniref:O-antigen ligase family protein n=1 Tax=Streptococcus suis TaxID=1307 RepID=UPI000C18FB19|nr:hypothetical protein [Streptococcus suis]
MIFTFLSIVIGIYAFFDFKRAIQLFTIYQIIWYPTVIFNIGSVSLGTNSVIPLLFAILFFFKRHQFNPATKFPFTVPFVLIILSYLFSCFTALSGLFPEFSRSLMRVFSVYIYVYILWNVIETDEDFAFIFKGTTYLIFISCIYGIIEYVTGNNFVLDYKINLSGNTIETYEGYTLRGYRLTSLFEHPIGAGMTYGLYSIFTLSLFFNKAKLKFQSNLALITAILCIPLIILTKMRTPILFTIIAGAILVKFSRYVRRKSVLLVLVVVMALIPILAIVISSNSALLTNLFSTGRSAEIGGSSLEMRLNQMVAIQEIVSSSPIFGLGETFRNSIVKNGLTNAALGFEGIIFEQWSMHGIFGLVTTAILIYTSVIKIPLVYRTKEVAILSLAYWIAYIVSSLPSFRIVFYYLFIFYFIKQSEKYRDHRSPTV